MCSLRESGTAVSNFDTTWFVGPLDWITFSPQSNHPIVSFQSGWA